MLDKYFQLNGFEIRNIARFTQICNKANIALKRISREQS